MKRLLFLLSIVLTLTLVACSSEDPNENPNDDPKDDLLELTLEELAYYDGKEGRPAYIAVEGKIYDVTDSSFWSGGNHNGYAAGQDLTYEIINVSPHGISNLSRVPQVGILITGDE